MWIEFDGAKRAAILEARELDLARTGEVFAGATLTVMDDRRDYGEDRFITFGFFWKAQWWLRSGRRAATHIGSSA